MIPFILAAVGGYLIGDSMKSDATKMADGGMTKFPESHSDQMIDKMNAENSLLSQRKEVLEELINSDIIDEEHGYYEDVQNAIKSNDSEKMREMIDELLSSGFIYKDDWDYKLARKISKQK